MSVEPDPPLLEIVKRKKGERFESVRHGFDPAQVDDMLSSIVSRIETLEADLFRSRVAADVPRNGEDPARTAASSPAGGVSDVSTQRIDRLGSVAMREIERMLAEAKTEAAAIVADAGIEADRITRDARVEARLSVDEARAFLSKVEEGARGTLSDVAARRRQMTEELGRMREHLVSVAQELDTVLDHVGPDADLSARSARVETAAGS